MLNKILYRFNPEGQAPRKEILMKRELSNYIDQNIIRERDKEDRYHLSVVDLSTYEKQTLINWMFEYDPATYELVLDRMEELLKERIECVERQDKRDAGLKPSIDPQTGETRWGT
jgi:hypothetical protein